jgi:hypothetical protein
MFDNPVDTSVQNDELQKISELVAAQNEKAAYSSLVQKTELTSLITEKLDHLRAKTAELEGERVMENTKSKIALENLTGKFSLIGKIQQSLG